MFFFLINTDKFQEILIYGKIKTNNQRALNMGNVQYYNT